jgi:two-component system OmpR family sensor kinase
MTLSLRGRLLIGVISLVLVGLLISDVATYGLLQKSLIDRVDAQLTNGDSITQAVGQLGGQDRNPGGQAPSQFPIGSVVELLGPDGSILISTTTYAQGTTPSSARPRLPNSVTVRGTDSPSQPFTVEGSNGVSEFRVTAWSEDFFHGQTVVLAIPLTDVRSTLSQLLLLELLIGVVVLGAVAALAWLIIQLSLRPLQRMGGVAQQIAAGDLTRRVQPATESTEIGRLGLALNTMLNQIEAAFEQRKASENRLRRFIADASHELRTPLTSIRGYSEMLRRGAAKSRSDSELARRRIEEESVRMTTLVDDMLLIARLDQGRPLESRPVDLQTIARDAADDARAVAPQREINVDSPGPVIVTGDDTRLRQVLGNLVRNALVHTPPTTPLEIGLSTENGFARMSVADHGPGLGPDDVKRIFEPFYRADPSRSRDSGGAGLGLSIVTAVVSAHGGQVKVKETRGGGATFEVELPLVHSPH